MTLRRASLLTALLLTACGETTPPSPAGPPVELVSVPHPDVADFKADVQAAIGPARAAFEQQSAVKDGAALGEAFGKLGLVYQAHEQQEAAAACFINAASLLPDDHRWPYHLAVLREETGEFTDALALYEATLQLDPTYSPAATRQGLLQIQLGDADTARATLQSVVDTDRQNAAALAGLGDLARDRGDHERARALYTESLTLDPAASQIRYRLGLVYRALGQIDEARAALAGRGERIPRIRDPLLTIMQAHKHPASHYIDQANAAIGQNDLRRSAQLLSYALAVEPEHEEGLVAMGEVLLAARQDDAARGQFETLSQAYPENVYGPYYLGLIAMRSGDRDKAIRLMDEALAIDPEFDRANKALSRLRGN
ncbi:MAG: tetratricopeptide repeat protein [Pseudomonadota bacterium]